MHSHVSRQPSALVLQDDTRLTSAYITISRLSGVHYFADVAGGLHAHIQTRLDEISRHRISLGVIAQTTSDNMREITFALDSSFSLHQHQCADPQGLLLRLLATDLRTITTGYPGSPLHWTRNNSLLRRVFEWLSMMTTYSCDNILLRLRDPYLDGIRSILINEPIQQMLLSSKAPGLRTLAFILACEHARICIDDDSSLGMSQLLFRFIRSSLIILR